MVKFFKNRFVFIILVIIILLFSFYKIFYRNYPILKPTITIKYNNEKILSTPGEHSWFNLKEGG
ncbi:hypothetical protein QYZ60_14755, partial [Clostridium perfringens]|nr:hypothetical protein [Clostridium perfringens]